LRGAGERLLKDLGEDYVWSLLNALIRADCIAVSAGQYPTLSLTQLGGDVMRCQQKIQMVLPELKAGPPVKRRARSGDRRKTTTRAKSEEVAEYDEKLFDALRAWRLEKARALGGVPAYIVYPDRTLQELARRKPQTEAELLEVKGIGSAKARQFGGETLAVVRKFGR
jgi:ATP-dependent DNA helicase RecQ